MEAIDFSELEDDFGALQTVVLGVSMDDCVSHGAFRDKHGLSVQLLADPDGEVCQRYGVLQDKEMDGQEEDLHRALDVHHRPQGPAEARALRRERARTRRGGARPPERHRQMQVAKDTVVGARIRAATAPTAN